jgi:undecaprenyl diphosphate synthase
MGLVLVAVSKYLTKLAGDGVRIRIVGDRDAVSDKLRAAWDRPRQPDREQQPHHAVGGLQLRRPLGRGAGLPQAVAEGLRPDQVDEALAVAPHGAGFAPDPDLFIRTGGEMRISNFLLWQAGLFRTVLHRLPVARFRRRRDRRRAAAYAQRDRRFGGIQAQPSCRKAPDAHAAAACHHRPGAAGLLLPRCLRAAPGPLRC